MPDPGAQVATPTSPRVRGPRTPWLLRLTLRPRFRRALQRAVSLLVILAWLLEPLAPVAASPRQPQAQAPGCLEMAAEPVGPGVGAPERGRAASPAPLAASSPVPGITVYSQADVNCANPQYAPITPYYYFLGWGFGSVGRSFFICSEGATVHIELLAEVYSYW
ncbi:MAG: hypothetical protein QME94_17625, partial [Anaerolineae bacterium]|nr:hypothetical protein [Anaerolineae bacterium]